MTHGHSFHIGRTFTTSAIVWFATALAANAQAPNITAQPVPLTVQVGDSATFSVTATGAAPLSYQWKLGATNLPGATTNPLVLLAVAYADAGELFRRRQQRTWHRHDSIGKTPSHDSPNAVAGGAG